MAGADFFVSHAGRDQAWAEWVAWHLVDAGYTVELDSWDWAAGENFVARMHGAVDAAKRVVALFSPAYFEDLRYTTEEWTSALVKNDDGGHRLVPVQIEPCAVPSLLRPLLRVELFGVDEAEAARRLIAAARGPARPDGKPGFPGQGRAGMLTVRGESGPRLPGVLPPVWNVGPRNPSFVGRDATLVQLRERLRSGGTAVVQALHGLGGVGKTQMAIEYAHRYAGAYDVVWWISAEETGLIGEQYAALAVELDLTPARADTASAVGALRAYLRGRGRWLLLLDNAESPRELRDWLPAGPGHTLITSRNPGLGELAARVEVDVLPRPDSVELIQISRPGVAEAEADRLAEALGDLPLALVQAAGFLAETGMLVDHYLGLLETRAEELLDQSPPESHPLSLAAAIRVSTDRLGFDLHALGQVEAARQLHEDSLARARRVLGEDHFWTIECANNLAAALYALGEAEAARDLGEDTLTRARRVLGDESHFTIDVANNLATVLQALSELEAARQLSEDTLARARRVFGDNHPRTQKAADNLATALRLLAEAESARQGDSDPVDEP